MHSFWYRANALATFAGTVLAGMCLLVTITDYFHTSHPSVSCTYLGVEGLQKEFGHDRAYIVLNASLDLRSEFSWNTKQLFVHVDVEFATRRNARNQIVMWHSIILNKEDAVLHLPALRQQYPYAVTDQGFSLRGREFNVTVAWNVMPRVGALFSRSRSFGPFWLPDSYHQPAMGKLVQAEGLAGEESGAHHSMAAEEEADTQQV